MRIAFISFWSCPLTRVGVLNAGGMSIYILNLAEELAKLGVDVDIFTKSHKDEKHTIVSLHKKLRLIHLKDHININYLTTYNYHSFKSFSHQIYKFIKENNLSYDILYSHYFISGMIGIDIKKKLDIPLFQTFHTLSKMKELYAGIKDRKRESEETGIIKNADGIIATTSLEKQALIKNYNAEKSKIYIIEPGVNHDIFKKYNLHKARIKLDLPENKKIILFVGRIDPLKGINLLIETISDLADKYPSFKEKFEVILIGGDIGSRHFWQNPEVIKITRIIEDKDLSCCVKFLGSKPHHILPFYYSASDIIVMPSAYESFGLVVLEAMACGKAVVASEVGGLAYLIKDKFNGRLFKSGDKFMLADIIWDLLNNEDKRSKLGIQALKSSQKFCWDKQALKLMNIFKKLS